MGGQTDPDNEPGKPKAYLNWILLDEKFNYVPQGSGFMRVGSYDAAWRSLATTGLPIAKSGYLFVYWGYNHERNLVATRRSTKKCSLII